MDVFTMPVHPAAAIFPMLPDEELDELVADIQAHGLQQPIVVQDGQLIDGRNRREACRRVGVEPRVVDLNGADATAYILSANIARRHLTKGQRAMAVAKLYPESLPNPGRKGRLSRKDPGEIISRGKFSDRYLQQARIVLAGLPEAADAVLAGTLPLADAYAQAVKIRDGRDSDEKRLQLLRERASDLADLVDEGRVALIEAESVYETRQETLRRRQHTARELLNGIERMVDVLADGKGRAEVVEDLSIHDDDRERALRVMTQWIANLTATKEALNDTRHGTDAVTPRA